MKNGPTKIMCFSTQGKCEEDRAELELHCDKIDNGLQSNKDKTY